jgi:hypothetical protein
VNGEADAKKFIGEILKSIWYGMGFNTWPWDDILAVGIILAVMMFILMFATKSKG